MRKAFWFLGIIIGCFIVFVPVENVVNIWKSDFPQPLTNQIIVLDPGHGGYDSGAVGDDQTLEKDITLLIAKKLRAYLEEAGAVVYLTREVDEDLAQDTLQSVSTKKANDIRNRVKFIEEKDADFFLSIHLNALSSSRWSGAQTFYHPKQDGNKALANHIQNQMIKQLGNTTREALAIDNIYLLKHTDIPGALVEVGFLSNEQERKLLKTNRYQQKVAASIYHGIYSYVTEETES